ncbi:hypothetical protein GEOBRER4_n0811 [Citrifermentans bremense]|uniref:Uncharacterized protein n=1 Tax=Citrifermentans bremense TaxID=60035 RepID=A0A7R7FT16_9BACT|nr:hypothetical protein GEOBRER4_n0811 [Citrifermentans bremense]
MTGVASATPFFVQLCLAFTIFRRHFARYLALASPIGCGACGK